VPSASTLTELDLHGFPRDEQNAKLLHFKLEFGRITVKIALIIISMMILIIAIIVSLLVAISFHDVDKSKRVAKGKFVLVGAEVAGWMPGQYGVLVFRDDGDKTKLCLWTLWPWRTTHIGFIPYRKYNP
jgi:hypothetical protein